MQVILLEKIVNLGNLGDVVKVKDGFARNFLLPNKKALRSNAANRKVFEANRARIEADNASRRGDAEKEAVSFKDASVTLIRQASRRSVVRRGRRGQRAERRDRASDRRGIVFREPRRDDFPGDARPTRRTCALSERAGVVAHLDLLRRTRRYR